MTNHSGVRESTRVGGDPYRIGEWHMPDLTNLPALDVAIGLILVYGLLALIVSGLNEAIARAVSLRARFLEEGIRNLLNDPSGQGLAAGVLQHPLVRGLQRNGAEADPESAKLPSYIPSRTFAAALFDTIAPPEESESRDLVQAAKNSVSKVENEAVRRTLLTLLGNARQDLDGFRKGVEDWYDASMDRVSGWYKRRVQTILLVLSLLVALGLNADSFQVANTLWNNDAVRHAVVAEADQISRREPAQGTIKERLERTAQDVEKLESLKLPIGWSGGDTDPRRPPDDVLAWLMKFIGIALTGVAVSLGAPFWFDTLGKALRLRSTGKPERSSPAST